MTSDSSRKPDVNLLGKSAKRSRVPWGFPLECLSLSLSLSLSLPYSLSLSHSPSLSGKGVGGWVASEADS